MTGATGYVGGRLVPRLLNRGYHVRALARSPAKLDDVPWRSSTEVVRGDLSDPQSLESAFEDVDIVYYLVHSMGTSADFGAEECRSAKNVVAAARAAGVRRLVYLSGLHPAGARLSPHLESRTAVGDILLSSGIETLVLQAGVIIGSGSASFEMIRHLTDRLPVMTTPKWVHNTIQPIAVRDVMHYLVEAATADVPTSRTWDIGGPDVLEYGEMMQIYADTAGLRRRVIIVLPFLTPTIASWWVGLVTPIPPGLARPLVESLHCNAVMADHDIDGVIPHPSEGLIGYREAVELALARIGHGEIETCWSTATHDGEPSVALPSDPAWAGEITYTASTSANTRATPSELWKAIEATSIRRGWHEQGGTPGELLRFRTPSRQPGQMWLEMRVSRAPGQQSRYEQRMVFYPHGIAGRVYWYAGILLQRLWLRRLLQDVTASAATSADL